MREIKFRAWDREKKEFVYLYVERFMTTRFQYKKGLDRNKLEDAQQFTGLKDKHGKEIYEGDIVEWIINPIASNPEKCHAEVRWSGQLLLPHINSSSEIIGNIYENPVSPK